MAYPKIIQSILTLFSTTASHAVQMPPVGSIIDYYGELDSTWKHPIKNGVVDHHWRICDGHEGTPDLRDKFIVGAGGELMIGNAGGAKSAFPSIIVNDATQTATIQSALQSVSVNAHTLVESQTPAHGHGFFAEYGATADSNKAPASETYMQAAGTSAQSRSLRSSIIAMTGNSGSHTHGITTAEHTHTLLSDSHSHQLTITETDTRPPFVALYKIMRMS